MHGGQVEDETRKRDGDELRYSKDSLGVVMWEEAGWEGESQKSRRRRKFSSRISRNSLARRA